MNLLTIQSAEIPVLSNKWLKFPFNKIAANPILAFFFYKWPKLMSSVLLIKITFIQTAVIHFVMIN